MTVISLRIDDSENKLIKDFAEANNMSVSELFRESVLARIEDVIDLESYKKAMAQHVRNPQSITFEQMTEELDN